MKRYILSAMASGALLLGAAYGQTAPPGSTAHERQHYEQRQADQRARIQQGEKSGSLRPGQAERMERQDRRINREAKGMAAKSGGNLSAGQEAKIHRQMNRQSRHIYRAKH